MDTNRNSQNFQQTLKYTHVDIICADMGTVLSAYKKIIYKNKIEDFADHKAKRIL